MSEFEVVFGVRLGHSVEEMKFLKELLMYRSPEAEIQNIESVFVLQSVRGTKRPGDERETLFLVSECLVTRVSFLRKKEAISCLESATSNTQSDYLTRYSLYQICSLLSDSESSFFTSASSTPK